MRTKTRLLTAIGVAGSMCAGCGGSGGGQGQPAGGGPGPFAQVTVMGQDFGLAQSAINDNGLMVGSINVTNTNNFADSWQVGGKPVALPGPGVNGANKGVNTAAFSINDSATIAGCEFDIQASKLTPVVWQNGAIKNLATPAGPNQFITVTLVNNKNQLVGMDSNALGINFSPQTPPPLFWANPAAQPVQMHTGFIPAGLNDSGVVVGAIFVNSGVQGSKVEFFKANLASPGNLVDLGINVPQNFSVQLGGIVVNNSGTIVVASTAAYDLIQISPSGSKTTIGTAACPQAMNAKGDVVGQTLTGHGFLWTAAKGLVDLNSLIDPSLGLTVQDAYGINDGGVVLAHAKPKSGALEFVLIQLLDGQF